MAKCICKIQYPEKLPISKVIYIYNCISKNIIQRSFVLFTTFVYLTVTFNPSILATLNPMHFFISILSTFIRA